MADESEREWNREKTELLISEIEKRPELYNTTLKAYSNRDIRKRITLVENDPIITCTIVVIKYLQLS